MVTGLWACSSDDSATPSSTTTDAGTTLDSGTSTTPDAGCVAVPATGFTQIVPTAEESVSDPGDSVAMTLDAAGNPVVAYLDGLSSARTLKTLRWDPCAGAWTTPITVDTLGSLDRNWTVGIATDAKDGRIAISYAKSVSFTGQNPTVAAFVAISKDAGATFTTQKVSTHTGEVSTGSGTVHFPVVALAGGKTFVAFNQDLAACGTGGTPCLPGTVLATSTDGTTFTQEAVSDGVNATYGGHLAAAQGFHPGIAVDSNGAVAVATHSEAFSGYDVTAFFCRAGTTCTKVMDSQNKQNDDGSAEIAFSGTTATVITKLQLDSSGTYDFRASTSTDGTAWSAVTTLPIDGDSRSSALAQTGITTDSSGSVYLFSSASEGSTAVYGAPKIFKSGTPWTVSGASAPGSTQPEGQYPTGRVTAGGKIMLTFKGSVPRTEVVSGVTFWSQP